MVKKYGKQLGVPQSRRRWKSYSFSGRFVVSWFNFSPILMISDSSPLDYLETIEV